MSFFLLSFLCTRTKEWTNNGQKSKRNSHTALKQWNRRKKTGFQKCASNSTFHAYKCMNSIDSTVKYTFLYIIICVQAITNNAKNSDTKKMWLKQKKAMTGQIKKQQTFQWQFPSFFFIFISIRFRFVDKICVVSFSYLQYILIKIVISSSWAI